MIPSHSSNLFNTPKQLTTLDLKKLDKIWIKFKFKFFRDSLKNFQWNKLLTALWLVLQLQLKFEGPTRPTALNLSISFSLLFLDYLITALSLWVTLSNL